MLRAVYDSTGIAPDDVTFVEAHGTGTRVGDPTEAQALGHAIARRRRRPLPIGSVKSNLGHLEPASGVAGLLKATLALEHELLPASLNCDVLNPEIPFAELNLEVARTALPLEGKRGQRFAGVSTFGFGGTNAHVIIADAAPVAARSAETFRKIATPRARSTPDPAVADAGSHPSILVLSAHDEAALQQLARALADQVRHDDAKKSAGELTELARALVHHRDLMPNRAVIVGEIAQGLDALAKGEVIDGIVRGRAVTTDAKLGFVYSGNGSQWAGMGVSCYRHNQAFRRHFDRIDALFEPLADWSLRDALVADNLAERLKQTIIAQPLLFALQAAATDALIDLGLAPFVVIGHSVGEVAAAYASGAFTLEQAVRVIYERSQAQEFARGAGQMAVLHVAADVALNFLAAHGLGDVEIAAINSPRSVTIVGEAMRLRQVLAAAEIEGLSGKLLDIDYPFHSRMMDASRPSLLDALRRIEPGPTRVEFVSTVTGSVLPGETLSADYWWRNVRLPVQFASAVETASELGAGVFVEIGPRPVLRGYLEQILAPRLGEAAIVTSFERSPQQSADVIEMTLARAIAHGARFDADKAFGPPPANWRALPGYPWQRTPLRSVATSERLGGSEHAVAGDYPEHALLGWQPRSGEPVWYAHHDTLLFPEFSDHRVAGAPWFPAAAFIEMALAAAQRWLGDDRVILRDLDIIRPLVLSDNHIAEVRLSLFTETMAFEIASRRRLSEDPWELHVRGRFSALATSPAFEPGREQHEVTNNGRMVEAARVYELARDVGLDYGQSFRRLCHAIELPQNELLVELTARSSTSAASIYALEPTELDASFHGLFALLDEGRLAAPGKGFIPVHFGEVRLFRPCEPVARAHICRLRASSESLVADLDLMAADGSTIATLREARFAAIALLKHVDTDRLAYHFAGQLTALPGEAQASGIPELEVALDAARRWLADEMRNDVEEPRLLMEAAAERIVFDALLDMSGSDGHIDLSPRFDADERKAPPQYLAALVKIAEEAGLIDIGQQGARLAADCPLPPLSDIIRTVLAENPDWGADCALAAFAASASKAMSSDDASGALAPTPALLEHFATSAPRTSAHLELLDRLITALVAVWKLGRPVRILELGPGNGALTRHSLLPLLAYERARIVVADTNADRISALSASLETHPGLEFAALSTATAGQELAALGPFDLVVSANSLNGLQDAGPVLSGARRALVDGGLLVATEALPNHFHDVVFGLLGKRFSAVEKVGAAAGPLREPATWQMELSRAGFGDVQSLEAGKDGFSVFIARSPSAAAEGAAALTGDEATRHFVEIISLAGAESDLLNHLRYLLPDGRYVSQVAAPANRVREVVLLLDADLNGTDPVSTLTQRIIAVRDLLSDASTGIRLWIVAPGGARALVGAGPACPIATALWAASRTAANEHPGADIRLVDFEVSLRAESQAARLAAWIADPGLEQELVLTNEAAIALRAARGLAPGAASGSPHLTPGEIGEPLAAARTLGLSRAGSLDNLQWRAVERREPEADEVEIEVAASGLNFRDVMWALGMLPAEALEDGFSGATLGFECAGRVVRMGQGVDSFKPGDAVIALAPSAFSSHVTVASAAVSPIPLGIDATAAATVPVAFLSAYYALHHLGPLAPGQWLLVHGGAGGVGLAALQIAQWRGARVIATAGTEEKRELLKHLGAEHVLSSRSLSFVDEVRALCGDGVHVVLNSLSGEAMERSLELVRPFGRFLELGKRDYYANTKIALRPFRRNVSYYGIDVDQLLRHEPELASRLMREVSDLLEARVLTPLPYRRFGAEAAIDAFRLMQHSGHIGKIVLMPPSADTPLQRRGDLDFRAAGAGAHLVVGGLSGFGLATAQWLAARGARTLVLVSRTGKASEDAAGVIDELRHGGVTVEVEACDVTDRAALQDTLARVRASAGPIKGIVHAAMVLDDGALSGLSPQRIEGVLAPKVQGATNLDALTREDPLDYFVLYSSVTTLFGNPGQAAYVAANGYLEGLARQRRSSGLKALAVSWGAITDTGYLARNTATADILKARTGAQSFTAREALRHLGRMLAQGDGADAVVTVAPIDWSSGAGARVLPVLVSPTFRAVRQQTATAPASGSRKIDLAAETTALSEAEARRHVAGRIREAVASILRMPPGALDAARPLADMGMDSLMSLELKLALEERCGIDLPLGALSDSITINDLSVRVLAGLRSQADTRAPGDQVRHLVAKHTDAPIDEETLDRILDHVEQRRTTSALS